jgi:hypothetical protein
LRGVDGGAEDGGRLLELLLSLLLLSLLLLSLLLL